MLLTRKSCFKIWNLKTYKEIDVPFEFKHEETDQSAIHVFPDTSTFCIQECGRYNDNTFKLSYFKFPIKDPAAKPFIVFDSDEVWTHEYLIRKANNHSMLCWFKGKQDKMLEVRTFDFRDGEGKYNKHLIPNTIGKGEKISKVLVSMITMWEMRPFEFLFVTVTNRPSIKEESPNNNYIVDVRNKQIREAKFKFGKYQDFHVDQHYLGNFCMFRTFDFNKGIPLETPVYYIHNQTEKIIAEDKWKCSYLHKYEFPGYDGSVLAESLYENANVE